MRRVDFIFLAVFFGISVFVSCSTRKNPAKPGSLPRGQVVGGQVVNFKGTLDLAHNALFQNGFRPDPDNRLIQLYLPPGYERRGSGRPFPTLYLLHDFGLYPNLVGQPTWNQGYFDLYELAPLMDRLIASGEIQPMIVVQVDLAEYFYGGGFYTNSTSTARYFTSVDSSLVSFVDQNYNTVFGRRSRAISGHGMGGYGALKMVLMGNDTTFGSVSALSAPLAFGDSGITGKGFQSPAYRFAIFDEAGDTGIDVCNFSAYRSDTIVRPRPLNTLQLKTNLLFDMAAAFSPADTTFRDSINTEPPINGPGREALLARYPTYFQFSKSTSDPGFLFPFDSCGAVIESVWNRWIDHDIKRIVADSARRLDYTPLYFSCGLQDELGMLEQNRDFYQRLLSVRPGKQASSFIGIDSSQFYYEEYAGYPGRPAGHSTFIADQLVKILKFHTQFLDTATVP